MLSFFCLLSSMRSNKSLLILTPCVFLGFLHRSVHWAFSDHMSMFMKFPASKWDLLIVYGLKIPSYLYSNYRPSCRAPKTSISTQILAQEVYLFCNVASEALMKVPNLLLIHLSFRVCVIHFTSHLTIPLCHRDPWSYFETNATTFQNRVIDIFKRSPIWSFYYLYIA